MSAEKKLCYACNTELTLVSASFPMGSTFAHERFHADIYRCPQCGRVELFAAEMEENVICPVCGASHSPKEKCPVCAINAAFSNHAAQ
ncbi:MAG: hypothetical protein K6G54_06245 [Oscillospiraceae bacterium]|nr:hypothetical protein [Oscillospiraceae bacterium]